MPEYKSLAAARALLIVEVPLMIERYKTYPASSLLREVKDVSKEVAAVADLLEDPGTPKNKLEDAFDSLIEAVTLSAFHRGGVTVVDAHFEAHHPAVTPIQQRQT